MVNSQGQGASSEVSSDAASQGGESVNYAEILENTQRELHEARQQAEVTQSELASVKGQASKATTAIDKIRESLTGESAPKVDPVDARIESLKGQMDQYLEAAVQAEKAGRPIPLTVNSAINSLNFQIEALNEKREMQKVISELQGKVNQLGNPANSIDMQAYSNMDTHIISSLNTIFGQDASMSQIKGSQFEAISRQITREIGDLKKNDPDTWDQIRRDRTMQVKLVNHFVKQNIPPKARQLMEEDTIRKTPMETSELVSAFREAKELVQSNNTPKTRALVSELRQQVLERLWEKNAGQGTARVRASELFS